MKREQRGVKKNAAPGNGKGRSDKRKPETIDAKTGKTDPAPRRIDLSSLRDVRLEMAQVYRMVDRKELESHDGSRRVFMLRQIADVIVNTELEQRVDELEKRRTVVPPPTAAARSLPARVLN